MYNIAHLPQFYTDIKGVQVTAENITPPAMTSLCRPTPPLTSNTLLHVLSQTFDMPESVMPQTATNLPSPGDATSSSSVEEQWVTHAQSFIERDNLNHDDICCMGSL